MKTILVIKPRDWVMPGVVSMTRYSVRNFLNRYIRFDTTPCSLEESGSGEINTVSFFFKHNKFNNKMKMNIYKFAAIMLLILGSASSCKDDNIDMSKIDFSNIKDLHAQPLPVIQKCVEGNWKWILITFSGVWGGGPLNNTFVNITKNEVVVEQDSCDLVELNMTFTYNWKEKKTLSNYTSYVMWNNKQQSGEWYFDKIQNDTLYVYSYNANSMGYSNLSLFLRIK